MQWPVTASTAKGGAGNFHRKAAIPRIQIALAFGVIIGAGHPSAMNPGWMGDDTARGTRPRLNEPCSNEMHKSFGLNFVFRSLRSFESGRAIRASAYPPTRAEHAALGRSRARAHQPCCALCADQSWFRSPVWAPTVSACCAPVNCSGRSRLILAHRGRLRRPPARSILCNQHSPTAMNALIALVLPAFPGSPLYHQYTG